MKYGNTVVENGLIEEMKNIVECVGKNKKEMEKELYLIEIELNHTKTLLKSCEEALADRDKSSKIYSEKESLLVSKASEMLEMLSEIVESYKSGNEDNFIMSNLIDKSEQLIKEATAL